jgi:hypothetical protein
MIRVVGWNCNQGLASKAHKLLKLHLDVAVLCEAGRETQLGDGHLRRVGWTGRNETKGLAVFVRDGNDASTDDSWDPERAWYLPVHVDIAGGIDILAVWASYERSLEPRSRWVRTLSALEHYRPFLSGGRAVVLGDFNNSAHWDTPTRPVFSRITEELAASGYESVYHSRTGEVHGQESAASFYHRRDLSKRYLIDHAFIPSEWRARVSDFQIGGADEWLEYSDHMPLILDLGS